MSNIGGVSVLAAIIAQEIRARRRATSPGGTGGHPSPRLDPGEGPLASAQLTLQQRIASRLKAIDGGDPDRHGKGLRIFLEAVLLEEFGTGLIEDPSFHQLLTDVHTAMMTSEALAQPIRSAMSDLLGD